MAKEPEDDGLAKGVTYAEALLRTLERDEALDAQKEPKRHASYDDIEQTRQRLATDPDSITGEEALLLLERTMQGHFAEPKKPDLPWWAPEPKVEKRKPHPCNEFTERELAVLFNAANKLRKEVYEGEGNTLLKLHKDCLAPQKYPSSTLKLHLVRLGKERGYLPINLMMMACPIGHAPIYDTMQELWDAVVALEKDGFGDAKRQAAGMREWYWRFLHRYDDPRKPSSHSNDFPTFGKGHDLYMTWRCRNNANVTDVLGCEIDCAVDMCMMLDMAYGDKPERLFRIMADVCSGKRGPEEYDLFGLDEPGCDIGPCVERARVKCREVLAGTACPTSHEDVMTATRACLARILIACALGRATMRMLVKGWTLATGLSHGMPRLALDGKPPFDYAFSEENHSGAVKRTPEAQAYFAARRKARDVFRNGFRRFDGLVNPFRGNDVVMQ